jgi:hypothetical protein
MECSGPDNPSSLAVEARQLNFRFADDSPRSVGSTFDLLVRRGLFNRNREGLSNKQGVWHSIDHAHQTSLRRDADASKQVGEPGIGAKGVPERLYFEVRETIEPLLVSLF